MLKYIHGSGGGGKGGGGGGRTPVESPDSLHSKQYARWIDLISEGEIGGLVNGLQSVVFDDTPLMNADGTYNFSGVAFDMRNGTQSQTPLSGFSETETEKSVSVQVKYDSPVIRSIVDASVNSVVVTLGFPALSYQNPSTGDLTGTSVDVSIDVQTAGGGWKPFRIGREDISIGSGTTLTSPTDTDTATISVSWTGGSSGGETYNYKIQGQRDGGAWTDLLTGTISGYSGLQMVIVSYDVEGNPQWAWQVIPATGSNTHNLSLTRGTWNFRLVQVSGTGSATISGTILTWREVDTISGKTTSRYRRSYRIPLDGEGPWDIRVRRLTADSTQSNLANTTYWDSYTEVIEAKLSYPNSAIAGVQLDATNFSSVPSRGYEIYGIKVKVPSNYDPKSRTYNGFWDGTFKVAWTNNPAWIYYDILTSKRYGVGRYIDQALIDKWALYEIAQYCDEPVSDGFGGLEPRFTCSTYIQSRDEAFTVIKNLASAFRGMAYYSAGQVVAYADKPTDASVLFTNANVVDGLFTYSGSSRKARHTVALVTWNDPAQGYKKRVEYVDDPEGIKRYGIVETSVTAFGCLSRGQAHRVGRWLLYTERLENDTVTFKTGLQGTGVHPGAVIKIADSARSNDRIGGRTFAATTTEVTLDSEVVLQSGVTYTLSTMLPDGSVEERAVINAAGPTDTIMLGTPLSDVPVEGAIWILSSDNIKPQTYRVLRVGEVEGIQTEITALVHYPEKYDLVEKDLKFEKNVTVSKFIPATPANFKITEVLYQSGTQVRTKLLVSWDFDKNSASYEVRYRQGDNNFATLPTSYVNNVEILDVATGNIEVYATGVNALGRRGSAGYVNYPVVGKAKHPAPVEGASFTQINNAQALIEWKQHVDLDVLVGGNIVVRHSPAVVDALWSQSVLVTEVPGSTLIAHVPLLQGTYLLAARDSDGNYSDEIRAIIVDGAATVAGFNFVDQIIEGPAFNGTKVGVIKDGSSLVLAGAETIDQHTATIDSWGLVDYEGGINSLGYYYFENRYDLGEVYVSRLTATLHVGIVGDVYDVIDNRLTPIDEWGAFDGNTVDATVELQVRTTLDNPTGSPTWSAWNKFFVGDYKARAFEFRLVFLSNAPTQQVQVLGCIVDIDMPDRVEKLNDLAIPATGMNVTFPNAFHITPAIGIMIENASAGDTYEVTSKTPSGFHIIVKNGGVGVARTIDVIATGYGKLVP